MIFRNGLHGIHAFLNVFISLYILLSMLQSENCEELTTSDGESLDFEWNVAVISFGESGIQFLCGGVLASPEKVITSAGCFDFSNNFDLNKRGTSKLRITDSWGHHRLVQSVTVHPNYVKGIKYDDIAVLKLEQPLITDTATIPKGTKTRDFVDGQDADFAISWKSGSGSMKNRNVYTMLGSKIIDNEECEKSYNEYYKKKLMQFDRDFPRGIDSSLICVSLSGYSRCVPKRASQLVKNVKKTSNDSTGTQLTENQFLMGTRLEESLSDRTDCDLNDLPIIFTNVGQHYKWIESI